MYSCTLSIEDGDRACSVTFKVILYVRGNSDLLCYLRGKLQRSTIDDLKMIEGSQRKRSTF